MRIAAVIVIVAVCVAAVVWYRLHSRQPQESNVPAPQTQTAPSVTMVNPSELLFSLATICDRLPPTKPVATQPSASDLVLYEDNWQQIEFAVPSNSAYIKNELANLRKFKDLNRVGIGYKNIYVRKDHPVSFHSLSVTLARLRQLVGDSVKEGKLYLSSTQGMVEVDGGFVFRLGNDDSLYGYCSEGTVAALGVEPSFADHDTMPLAQIAAKVASETKAFLVDWYFAEQLEPCGETQVKDWLQRHIMQSETIRRAFEASKNKR